MDAASSLAALTGDIPTNRQSVVYGVPSRRFIRNPRHRCTFGTIPKASARDQKLAHMFERRN
jgi:hypothetical protein